MLNLLFKKQVHSWKLFRRVILFPSFLVFIFGFIMGMYPGLGGIPSTSAWLSMMFMMGAIVVPLGLPFLVTIYALLTRDERPLIPVFILSLVYSHILFLMDFPWGAGDYNALLNGDYWRLFTEFRVLIILVLTIIFFFFKKYSFKNEDIAENLTKDRVTAIFMIFLLIFYFTGEAIARPLISITASNPEGTIYYVDSISPYALDDTDKKLIDSTILYTLDDNGRRFVSDSIPCGGESEFGINRLSPSGRYFLCIGGDYYRPRVLLYDLVEDNSRIYEGIRISSSKYGSNQLFWSPDETKIAFTKPFVGYLDINSGEKTMVGNLSNHIFPSFDHQGNFYYIEHTRFKDGVYIHLAELFKYKDGIHEKIHSFISNNDKLIPYTFSRDGKHLLYYTGVHGGHKIIKVDLATKEEKIVTEKNPDLRYDTSLQVSNYDGANKLYVIRPESIHTFANTIFELDLNGEEKYMFNLNDYYDSSRSNWFYFSPSYNWIVLKNEEGLVILNMETGDKNQLSSTKEDHRESIIGWI
jgi:hypothetical protein